MLQYRFYLLYILLFSLFVCSLRAEDEVEFQVLNNRCVLGDEVSFAIAVKSDSVQSENFSNITYNGAPITFTKSTSSNSSMSIINGKVYQEQSVVNKYVFTFTPTAEGSFTLPAMSYTINGVKRSTQAFAYIVSTLPLDSDFVFQVNLVDKRDFYYPSEVVDCEVVFCLKTYTGFVNRLPILSNVDLLDNPGLQLIADENATHKIMINNREFPVLLLPSVTTMDVRDYQVSLAFRLKFRAVLPGSYKIEDCIAKATVTTGRLSRTRDFFGQRQKEAINVYGKAKGVHFEVKSLPEKNKPEDFSGAMGSFNIDVISSSDSGFKVGDPVNLHITISGSGDWEQVKAPALYKMSAITDFFRTTTEIPAGAVSEDHTKKEFNLKLRVKSATVKEIPAIPFSYFDINKGEYVTKYSKPIPIKVFENTNKVEVLSFHEKEDAPASVEQEDLEKSTQEDVLEPEVKPIEIMDAFKGEFLSENHVLQPVFLYLSFLCLSLLALITALVYFFRSSFLDKLSTQSQVKRSNKICIQKLEDTRRRLSEGEVVYRYLTEILEDFLKLKYESQVRHLHKEDIHRLMESELMDRGVGQEFLQQLELLENLKYSKKDFEAGVANQLITDFVKVVSRC